MASTERAGTTTPTPINCKVKFRMDYAEAFANLQRHLVGEPDVVPDGWFTTKQWAKELNKPFNTVRDQVFRAHEAGLMERASYRVGDPPRATPHYRIKETAHADGAPA